MDTVSPTSDYDAFGDPAAGGRGRVRSTRRERTIAVAVFWSVAVLLVAGRIYQHDLLSAPLAHMMAMASR